VKVSFVIPTLNRRGAVNRAVRSCLAQRLEDRDIAVEVVVLDSDSDDGSWEELVAEFGSDERVLLRQNARGLGVVRSWLDGAVHVTGDFVTFVWSDDYLFDRFLPSLLPPLLDGDAMVCLSHGVSRDIADESPAPPLGSEPWDGAGRLSLETLTVSWLEAFAAFTEVMAPQGWLAPASPLVALFRREAFDAWVARVEDFSRSSPLAERVLWQKAIGPDLYLFLVALELTSRSSPITVAPAPVAQFSSHPDSITVRTLATQRWWFDVGYWLTRASWLAELAPAAPHQLEAAAFQRLGTLGVQYAEQAVRVSDHTLDPPQSIAAIRDTIQRLAGRVESLGLTRA
jgi:hypothetical protein